MPADYREENFLYYPTDLHPFGRESLFLSHRYDYAAGVDHLLITWSDEKGNVHRQAKDADLHFNLPSSPALSAWTNALAIQLPALVVGALPLSVDQSMDRKPDYSVKYRQGFAYAWPPMLAISLVAVAAAIACYRRQLKYTAPATTAWVIFVLLLGLPGLFGLSLIHICRTQGIFNHDRCHRGKTVDQVLQRPAGREWA